MLLSFILVLCLIACAVGAVFFFNHNLNISIGLCAASVLSLVGALAFFPADVARQEQTAEACRTVIAQNTQNDLVAACKAHFADPSTPQGRDNAAAEEIVRTNLLGNK